MARKKKEAEEDITKDDELLEDDDNEKIPNNILMWTNQENDVYFIPKEKMFVVRFDRLFEREDIEYATKFLINKRNYRNLIDKVCREYKLIIDNVPDGFLYFLMDIKYDIIKLKEKLIDEKLASGTLPKKIQTREDFYNNKQLSNKLSLPLEEKEKLIEKMYDILNEEELFEFIDQFVEENYTLDLDSKIDKDNKNSEYAITDRMNKVVLKTSIVSRLLIPIISEIGVDMNSLYLLLISIMNKFDGDTKRTRNKLYKFCELRVKRTLYSDKTIWKFLDKRGEDDDIVISNLNHSVITDIIIKLDYNKSIVSYFDVTIRKKIHWIFTFKYPVNYKIITISDKELDERDKIEIHLLRKDKYQYFLQKLTIEEICQDIEIPEEYNYLIESNNIFVTSYLRLYFGDELDPILADNEEKAKLILFAKDNLEYYGFTEVPKLLTSLIETNNKKVVTRKKFTEKISDSAIGQKFVNNYKDVMNLFQKNDPLSSYLNYNSYSFIDPLSNTLIEFETNTLIKEIMEMCIS